MRILDCTVSLEMGENGASKIASGLSSFLQEHLPNSQFIDLFTLSRQDTSLPFMVAPPEQIAEVLRSLGINNDSRVVLYDSRSDRFTNMWAARVWWILRSCGFDRAGILNGGLFKWKKENRPLTSEIITFASSTFTPKPRPQLWVDKNTVNNSRNDENICLINALLPEDFKGETNNYGRPGHIPGSVNAPVALMLDEETHAYHPLNEILHKFNQLGITPQKKCITYCGGGIAASSAAFLLNLADITDVAVYDGSLYEWASDPSLPLECSAT